MSPKYFLLFFIYFIAYNTYSQNAGEIEEIAKLKMPLAISPSPNAASLGKFGDIPISSHTGTADITVPIFTIEGENFQLPIEVLYHSAGIKVEEIGSSIGLGWALSAGGVITKSIRGKDDYLPGGYLYNNGEVAKTVEEYLNGTLTASEEQDFNFETAKGNLDTEPDEYFFKFGNYSGKFVFTPEGLPLISPSQNLKLNKILNGYEIIDSNGVKYIFSDLEITYVIPFYDSSEGSGRIFSDPFQYTSSWYMSKIILPNLEEITFEYSVATIEPEYIGSEAYHRRFNIADPCNSTSFPSEVFIKNGQNVEIQQKKLVQIIFSNGKIDFTYKTEDRGDLVGDKALQTITVSNLNKELKRYDFKQVYFNNRLFLSSITERSGAFEHPAYKFEYITPHAIPNRDSKAQDLWGFFNGETSNTTLIPTSFELFNIDPPIPPFASGANRKPHSEFSQVGSLNKITYPTGGYTVFDYGVHQYSNLEGSTEIRDTIQSTFRDHLVFSAQPTAVETKEFFSVPHNQVIFIDSELSGYNTWLKIFDSDGNAIYNHIAPNSDVINYKNVSIPVTEGEYEIVGFNYEVDFTVNLSVEFENISGEYEATRNRVGGGLRINSIKNYDSDNSLIQSKFYVYESPGEEEVSSGILVSAFVNEYNANRSRMADCQHFPVVAIANYRVRLANSALPLMTSGGSHVEYSDVQIFSDSLGIGGKTEQKFTTSRDYKNGYIKSFPFMVSSDLSFARGKVLQEKYYLYQHGTYHLINQVDYTYQKKFGIFLSAPAVAIGFDHDYSPLYGNSQANTFLVNYKSYTSQYLAMTKKTETLFGENQLRKETNYYRDSPYHTQITSIEASTSRPSSVSKRFFYPDDIYNNNNVAGGNFTVQELAAIEKLTSNFSHRISIPIQIETENQLAKEVKRMSYKIFDDGIVYPASIKSMKNYDISPGIWEEQIAILSYDDSGNPLEISMKDQIHTVYLWGYTDKYPIAKIENATAQQVSQVLGSDISLQDLDETDFQLIDSLRVELPQAQVTTFLYDPLIGVKLVKDPRGNIINYEYDEFQRLKYVKDQSGKIITENNYSYKAIN